MRPFLALFFLSVLLPGLLLAADLPLEANRLLSRVAPLMERKDYAQAVRILEEGLADKAARHSESYCALGNCHLILKKQQAALRAYEQALQFDSRNSRAWQGMARAHYENNNFKEAGRAFAQAYETGKKEAETLYYSAAAFLMAGSYKESIQQFERLFQAHPRLIKSEWQEYYIRALVAGGQGKKALPVIRTLVNNSAGADKLRWQELLLYQYVQLRMYREGRQYTHELLDADPGEARWWRALVHIQLASGQMEDALAALLACSHVTELKSDEQRLLADLYLQSGIPVKAAPIYRRQLAGGGAKKQTLQSLVVAYRQLGQEKEALALLDQYNASLEDAQLLMLQGDLRYGLRQYGEAANSFRQAARQPGHHQGQAWLMAGYAALQIQDNEAGLQALNQASRFDQQKKQAQSLLEKFAQTQH